RGRPTTCRRGRLVRAPCRGKDPPLAAEEVLALALDLPGAVVELEQVERVSLVGHLERPGLPLRRAEQLGLDARGGAHLPLLHKRWPEVGALAVAGAATVFVRHEEIERPARARCEHLAHLRRVERDASGGRIARGRRAGALMCDGRGRRDAGNDQREPEQRGYHGFLQHLSPPTGFPGYYARRARTD